MTTAEFWMVVFVASIAVNALVFVHRTARGLRDDVRELNRRVTRTQAMAATIAMRCINARLKGHCQWEAGDSPCPVHGEECE